MVTLNNRLHNKLNPDIFQTFISFEFSIYPVFIVPNLKYIHAIFMMLWPFKLMLVPRCSTGWSVAKLIFGSVLYQIGGKHWPHILVYVKFRSLASSSIKSNSCYHSCYFRWCRPSLRTYCSDNTRQHARNDRITTTTLLKLEVPCHPMASRGPFPKISLDQYNSTKSSISSEIMMEICNQSWQHGVSPSSVRTSAGTVISISGPIYIRGWHLNNYGATRCGLIDSEWLMKCKTRGERG